MSPSTRPRFSGSAS